MPRLSRDLIIPDGFITNGHAEAVRIISLKDNQIGRYIPPAPTPLELGLNTLEVSAVRLYTTTAYKYINNFSRQTLEDKDVKSLRRVLYERQFLKHKFIGQESLDKGVGRFRECLESARLKHPSNENFGTVVVRGLGFNYPGGDYDEYCYTTPDGVITQKAYTSTSVSRPFLNTHLLIIYARPEANGRWICPTSSASLEDEVLFAPGTKIRIKDVVYADEFEGANFIGLNFYNHFHVSKKISKLLPSGISDYPFIKKYIFAEFLGDNAVEEY